MAAQYKWSHWVCHPYGGAAITASQNAKAREAAVDAFERWMAVQPFSLARLAVLSGTVRYAREKLVPNAWIGPSADRYQQCTTVWAVAHYSEPLFAYAVSLQVAPIRARSSVFAKYVGGPASVLAYDTQWALQQQTRPIASVIAILAALIWVLGSGWFWNVVGSALMFGAWSVWLAGTPDQIRRRLGDAYLAAGVLDRRADAGELAATAAVGDSVDRLMRHVCNLADSLIALATRLTQLVTNATTRQQPPNQSPQSPPPPYA
jgi:hypothetical protein